MRRKWQGMHICDNPSRIPFSLQGASIPIDLPTGPLRRASGSPDVMTGASALKQPARLYRFYQLFETAFQRVAIDTTWARTYTYSRTKASRRMPPHTSTDANNKLRKLATLLRADGDRKLVLEQRRTRSACWVSILE